jgi:putative hydrolase of the HAD superfamily
MTIRGVTFDWWGTVVEIPAVREVHYDEEMQEIRVVRAAEALEAAGLPVNRTLLSRAYDAQTDLLLRTWNDLRDLSVEEQTRAYLRFLGVGEGREDVLRTLQEAFGSAIELRLPALYPEIGNTLRALRDRGYRTGLISNTGRTGGRFLRSVQDRLGIGESFDVRIFSDEVGVRKPDRVIFQAALDELSLAADEVVHVGDDVVADVAGAMAVGMRAIWFNTGFWKGAKADRADAEIRKHAELPRLLEKWR